jgi:hypothetical protein
MILFCDFNGITCSESDFEWYFHGFLGNCYRFNSRVNSSGHTVPTRKVSNSGKIGSLTLEIIMPKPIPTMY